MGTKRSTKRGLLSIVTGLTLTLMSAGAAHAVTVSHTGLQRTQVAMFSFLETTIPCGTSTATVTAIVSISGGDFVTRSPGGPTSSAPGTSVDVFSFSNNCTGESFGGASGFLAGGVSGPNQPLTSAHLTSTGVVLIDNVSTDTVPVSLNLTFTGNGQLSVSRDTTETRTADGPGGPFTITIQRGAFRNRSADVAGTITIDGVVFPVDLDLGATLLDNKSSTITVTKP
jgi:hypothetical protein